MTKLEQKLANAEELAQNTIQKEAIMEKSVETPAKAVVKKEKPKKITKKAPKPMKKEEIPMNKDFESAVSILQKVAKATKGHSLSGTGRQIVDDLTGEVKCCVCRHMAKVTMPIPKGPGIRPCEGNHHMTWIAHTHTNLEKFFKARLANKKTMYQFEKEVYGGPSPHRAKALGKSNSSAETLANIQARIKALKEKERIAKMALKAKKATKATKGPKTAKATA
jgi:hypothetical protein